MKVEDNQKGLNSKECQELIEYIQANNSWENMRKIYNRDGGKARRIIKYYSLRFDTRTGSMWQITFGTDKNTHIIELYESHDKFKEEIYDYLDEDIS